MGALATMLFVDLVIPSPFDTRVALIQALGGGWPDEATPQLAARRP